MANNLANLTRILQITLLDTALCMYRLMSAVTVLSYAYNSTEVGNTVQLHFIPQLVTLRGLERPHPASVPT